ncbi:MAG: FctA domain-containing protein [Bacillota bacterium]|nr:FctA domain-containing protein [Bacillota bacterium]
MRNKLIAYALSVMMVFTMFPLTGGMAFADDDNTAETKAEQTAEPTKPEPTESTQPAETKPEQQESTAASETSESSEETSEEETTEEEKLDADADYIKKGDVEAADVQGDGTKNKSNAKRAFDENTGLSDSKIDSVVGRVFASTAGAWNDPVPVPGYDRSGDGTDIESITAKWIISDSVDNGDPALLYVKPGQGAQQVRMQINYALSGEHNYGVGDVTITIPASMFKTRDGKDIGNLVIPFPKDPSKKGDFNWKLIKDEETGESYYVLTNTKPMSAATKGYMQFAITGLTPQQIVDMQVSDPFQAKIEVVTHKGNVIALKSNELTAQLDTEAKITGATKRLYGTPTRVKASQIPENQRIEGVEEYLKVSWYMWAHVSANTMYTMELVDTMPDEYDGFLIGATDEEGHEIDAGTVYTGTGNGQSKYFYYTVAYPAAQFEADTNYTFHNNVNFKVTEVDPAAEVTNPNVSDEDPALESEYSASAKTVWSYTDPKWYDPSGHFMVCKNGNDDTDKGNKTHKMSYGTRNDTHLWSYSPHGWYGIYPSAINEMQDLYKDKGEDGKIRLSYTIDSVGYVMPWMFDSNSFETDGELASRKSINYNKEVKMVTEDTGVSIGRNTEKLKVGEDYDFVEVEFPADPWLYTGVPQNINPDGSWKADNYNDGTFRYSRDSNKEHWPDIDLEIYRNGSWEKYATASWKSGSFSADIVGGGNQTDRVIKLPEGTQNFRTVVTLKNTLQDENQNLCLQAAIDYDMRAVIELRCTDEMMERIDAAFENSNTPSFAIYNGTNMKVYESKNKESEADKRVLNLDRDGYDSIRGYTTDTSVYPKKSSSQSLADVDYENRTIKIHYSAQVETRSVINDEKTYEQAIEEGRLLTETSGVWRDLLPKGVTPDPDSVRLRTKDRIKNVYTIEDYNGSGRTMLVVEAEMVPVTSTYWSGDMSYYEDVLRITFDAYYDFESYKDYGPTIHNVIAYESDNEYMGTIEKYTGEPDDPDAGNNISTPSAFKDATEKGYMTDLDDKRDDPSFVYAGVTTRLDVLGAARTSLTKDVQVNNDGKWGNGTYYGEPEENKMIVFEGGQYKYRLRMMSDDDTISKNLVIYDSLENFYAAGNDPTAIDLNDPIDIGAPHWHGDLRSVDVSQLREMGCAPVVYYSTIENLQLSDEDDPYQAHSTNMDLTNGDIWVKASDYTGDIKDVKAIAIDATKKPDGSDFELLPLQSATIIVNMHAPYGDEAREYLQQKGDWGDSAQAYNNAYMTCTSVDKDTLVEDGDNFVRKDYTKVGLEEFNFKVTKKWQDENNRDGKRPDSATFWLYANGEKTEHSLTLPIIDEETQEEVWEGVFENIPYTDEHGEKINYSIREEDNPDYDSSLDKTGDLYAFTNIHVPEKTKVSGSKTWTNDTEADRPEYIEVELYADGKYAQKKTVRPDKDGRWNYSFDNLYKYKDGQEIEYTIKEILKGKGESYISEVNGYDIVNTRHPYGDLIVQKEVTGVTDVSAETLFAFTFSFTKKDSENVAVPITTKYDYKVYEGEEEIASGQVGDGDTIKIKGGQKIVVSEVDEYVDYKVTEGENDGFTSASVTGGSGSIKPNTNNEAKFVNSYSATGDVNLLAEKTLYNRELKNYQFRYELYQVVDSQEILVGSASSGVPDETVLREDGTIDYSKAKVTFGALNFTQADSGHTYTYKIKEINTGKDGYTYDATIYDVVVTVMDKGDGTLDIDYKYLKNDEQIARPAFENTYEAEGQIVLRAWKNLEGRKLTNEEFTFELLNDQGEVIDTKKCTADGSITFDTIHYDEKDIGKIYNYAIREVKGDDETVNYTEEYYGYRVEVIDNDDGTLYAKQSLVTPEVSEGGAITGWSTDGAVVPLFVNTLKDGDLSITKTLTDADSADPEKTFKFNITLIGKDLQDLDLGDHYEAAPDGTSATFTTELTGGQTKTFEGIPTGTAYQIYEEAEDGWLLIEQDNVSGSIEPKAVAEATFNNKYQPGVTTAQFNGVKTLDGQAVDAGTFNFVLKEMVGGKQEVLQTKPTLAGGFVQFDAIQYEKEDVGVHLYTIEEVDPNIDTIDYDMHVEEVSVIVRENPDGTLTSEVVQDEDGIKFENKTRPGMLKLTKNAQTTEINEDTEFKFRITFTNDSGMPIDKDIYWYKEDKDGNVIGQNSLAARMAKDYQDKTPWDVVQDFAGKQSSKASDTTPADTSDIQQKAKVNKVSFKLPDIKGAVHDALNINVFAEGSEIFHATPEQLQGRAYAVITDAGEMIFFRSFSSYLNGVYYPTLTDIKGNTYSGRVFSDFENLDTGSASQIPWTSYRSSVRSVRVAADQAIRPATLTAYFMNMYNLRTVNLYGFDTSRTKRYGSTFLGCSSLKEIDMSTLDGSTLINTYMTFSGCTSLEKLDIRNIQGGTFERNNDMFGSCRNLNTVVLGPNWRVNNATLPTPPNGEKWARLEGGYDPMTASELRNSYNSAMAGTWVWESLSNIGYVEFDGNGGYTSAPRVKASSDAAPITMPDESTTSRLHYILKGWTKDPEGEGTLYQPGQTYTDIAVIKSTVTMYAQWEDTNIRYYTVEHYQQNTDLATYNKVSTEQGEGTIGDEVSPEVKHYDGFYSPEAQTVVILEDDSAIVKYYYDRITYNINFDGNGATSGQMKPKQMIVNVSDKLPANIFQKEQAIFVGWNTEPDGSGTTYTNEQSVLNLSTTDSPVTLYAMWMENPNEVLTPTNGEVIVSCKAGETIVIPDVPAGTKYVIEEIDIPDGWVKTGEVGTEGEIEANEVAQASVDNAYTAEGEIELLAHKMLEGNDLTGGEFSFELLDEMGNVLQTKTNDETDKTDTVEVYDPETEEVSEEPNQWKETSPVRFDGLKFTQDDIGRTFTYTIREVIGDDENITYDEHSETVKVTVSDAGHGLLKVEAEYDEDGALFVNRLSESNLKISKEIVGNNSQAGDTEFEFQVDLKGPNGEPIEGEFDVVKPVPSQRKVTKQRLIMDSQTKYSHTPNVSDSGAQNGSYSNSYSKTEVVSIPGAEKLHVTITYGGESVAYDWACMWAGNYPERSAYTSWPSSVTGKLGGGYHTSSSNTRSYDVDGDTVTFGFRSDGGGVGDGYGYYAVVTSYPVYEEYEEIEDYIDEQPVGTVTSGGTIKLKAGETYQINGLPLGTTYEVTEIKTDGWEQVSAEGNIGTIVKDEPSEAVFTNAYEAEGEAVLEATKTITGRELEDGQFTFGVFNEDDELIGTGTNDADGNIKFEPIYYDKSDDGQTYKYTIRELLGETGGVTYDEKGYTVTVSVADDGNGKMAADIDYGNGVTFTNNYESTVPEGSSELAVSKVLDGRDWLAEDSFEFTLTPIDGAPMPEGTDEDTGVKTVTIASDDADKMESFGRIEFSREDMKDAETGKYVMEKDFTYEIKEVIPEKDADKAWYVEYDENTYIATVNVKDDGEGNLVPTISYSVKPSEAGGSDGSPGGDSDGTAQTPQAQTGESGELVITNKCEYTDLKIIKKMPQRAEGLGENATLVFKIVGIDGEGNVIYENTAGISFDEDSGLFEETTVDKVPLDAEIAIAEVYAENFTPKDKVLQPHMDTIDGKRVWVVEFENDLTDDKYGSGVVNKYDNKDGNIEYNSGEEQGGQSDAK